MLQSRYLANSSTDLEYVYSFGKGDGIAAISVIIHETFLLLGAENGAQLTIVYALHKYFRTNVAFKSHIPVDA